MNLILCDDDKVFLNKLEIRIRGLCQKYKIAVEMECYVSAKEMLELQKKAGKKVPQIELQTGRQSVKLALRDIWFVESEKNYLLFYREKDTRDEAIRVRMKMSEAEKKLEAHKFVRTHKGYLVNMNYVYRLREKELLLLNGKSIPVSRNYLNQVRMKIMGVVME